MGVLGLPVCVVFLYERVEVPSCHRAPFPPKLHQQIHFLIRTKERERENECYKVMKKSKPGTGRLKSDYKYQFCFIDFTQSRVIIYSINSPSLPCKTWHNYVIMKVLIFLVFPLANWQVWSSLWFEVLAKIICGAGDWGRDIWDSVHILVAKTGSVDVTILICTNCAWN